MTSKFDKPSIAVIGASSMVGSRFCELANWAKIIKCDLHKNFRLDITKKEQVDDFFKNHEFSWAILFSAFTDVDVAERQRNDKNGICWRINVEGTRNIVDACAKFGKSLIYISTDFIFDGANGPYSEEDPPGPNLERVSWYGITKIEAEKLVYRGRHIILRITYPYRAKYTGKDDIAKRILRLYTSGRLYPLFTDQFITPTFVDDLAPALNLLIAKRVRGVFHLASPKLTTQYEFGKELITSFVGESVDIKKAMIEQFLKNPGATPRAPKGGLRTGKIRKLGFEPTSWEKGIEIIYNQSNGNLIENLKFKT